MSHGDFLRSMREAKGHESAASLATYAATMGLKITGQAIRNFETGRVPNAESREILSTILHLDKEHQRRFLYLCAHAEIQSRWGHLDLFIVDEFNRDQIARHVVDTTSPDVSRAERKELVGKVGSLLCNPV
jgi:hypothetical protein